MDLRHRFQINLVILLVLVTGCSESAKISSLSNSVDPIKMPVSISHANTLDQEAIAELNFSIMDSDSLTQGEIAALYEDRLVECMRYYGFQYFPRDAGNTGLNDSNDTTPLVHLIDGSSYSEKEFAERYGFGAAENLKIMIQGGDKLFGNEVDDPNLEYYETLSSTAQQYYIVALYGEKEIGGCYGIVEQSFLRERDPNTRIVDLNELTDRALQDKRVIAFLDEWRLCMRRQGFTSNTPDDLWQEYSLAADRAIQSVVDAVQDGTLAIQDAQREQISRLNAVQTKEIPAALANLECGGGIEDGSALFNQVLDEMIESQ